MSRTIASSYSQLQGLDFRTRSPIRAEDWLDIIRQQNLIWAKFVAEWGGHTFDPPFEAASTSSLINQAPGRDLNELAIGGIAERALESGDVRVGVAVYGNALVQYDIQNESTNTQVVTDAVINSGQSSAQKWRTVTHDLTATEAGDGSGGTGWLSVGFDGARESDTDEGDIFEIRAGEIEITTASEVPKT